MKKIILLFLICIAQISLIKAQPYVTITDPAWANYLTTNYPSCMTGNVFNGGCPTLVNVNQVNASGLGLTDVSGIQYFTNAWLIDVSNNSLTALPQLANNVYSLVANNNSISTIANYPPNCMYYYLQNNQLSYIPPVGTPSGLTLYCGGNNITCFGNFPPNSYTLDLQPNPFVCLPNHVPLAMNPSLLSTPICSVGNIYNCASPNAINGFFYKDMNMNCARDNGDLDLNGVGVKAYDNVGNLVSTFYSNINSAYHLGASTGTFQVKIDTTGGAWYVPQCLYPGYDSTNIVLTLGNPSINNVNFNLTCPNGFDLGCTGCCRGPAIFPGQPFKMKPHVGSLGAGGLSCAAGIGGKVILTYTGPVNVLGPYPGAKAPAMSAGNSFTYNIADFGNFPLYTDSLRLALVTQPSAVIGNSITMYVQILPNTPDNNPSNNTYSLDVVVGNSYDPNHKDVTPGDVLPGFTGWFNYQIQFQNVGNAPAYNIRLLDTLDSNLDLNSLQIIGSSHRFNLSINNGIANFFFPNIMLPDSASNPQGSIGTVQYRVKPKPGMTNGSKIKNRAHIYFDYNPVVNTNETVNNFVTVTGNRELQSANAAKIYPNPANSSLNINFEKPGEKTITLYDVLGKVVFSTQTSSQTFSINTSEYSGGVYLLKAESGQNASVYRIIVQK